MKKQALSALIVCLSAGALSAGFSLGRPAAVKRQVLKLDDKVLAARAAKAAQAVVNRAPVISGITAVSTTVAAGGLTAVSVSAADPDGDALTYLWTSTAGTRGGATKPSANWLAPSTPGVYAVTCTVSDGKIQVSSSVVVMAVTPGTAKWQFTASASISKSPAVGPDGTVYAVDDSGKLYAIKGDGTQKWPPFTTENTDIFDFPPVIGADGTLYLVAAGTKTYAVNPDTGHIKWGPSAVVPANNLLDPPVVGANGEVYLFDGTASAMYSLDQATGVGQSTFTDLPGIAVAPAIGPDGTLYVADTLGGLYAIPPGGDLGAPTPINVAGISGAPIVGSDGAVYWVDIYNSLNAANPGGTSKWAAFSPGSAIADRPVLGADGAIYLLDSTPYAYYVSSVTGAGHQITSVANVAMLPTPAPDGSAYMVDAVSPGKIYSVSSNGSNDTFKWGPFSVQVPATAINARPAVGADGTLSFPSNDNKLYAVYGASALPAP